MSHLYSSLQLALRIEFNAVCTSYDPMLIRFREVASSCLVVSHISLIFFAWHPLWYTLDLCVVSGLLIPLHYICP